MQDQAAPVDIETRRLQLWERGMSILETFSKAYKDGRDQMAAGQPAAPRRTRQVMAAEGLVTIAEDGSTAQRLPAGGPAAAMAGHPPPAPRPVIDDAQLKEMWDLLIAQLEERQDKTVGELLAELQAAKPLLFKIIRGYVGG